MVHFKPIKIIIDALGLAQVIIDVIVWHHSLPDLMVTNKGFLFISKFWSMLCYFLGINRKLSTAFYPQTDGQIKVQNSTMEANLHYREILFSWSRWLGWIWFTNPVNYMSLGSSLTSSTFDLPWASKGDWLDPDWFIRSLSTMSSRLNPNLAAQLQIT